MNKELFDYLLKKAKENRERLAFAEAQAKEQVIIDRLKSIRLLSGVDDFERQIAEQKIDPELAKIILNAYRKASQKLHRNSKRTTKKDQLEKLIPKLDLNKDWVKLQDELLSRYQLKVGRTLLLATLKKYRSRSH